MTHQLLAFASRQNLTLSVVDIGAQVAGLAQYCSLYDLDGGGEIDPGSWLWGAGSQRIAAHLAFDPTWHLPTPAANHALLEDLLQHRPMQGAPGPRGKARRTSAACGGRHARHARRRGGRGPRRLSRRLRA